MTYETPTLQSYGSLLSLTGSIKCSPGADGGFNGHGGHDTQPGTGMIEHDHDGDGVADETHSLSSCGIDPSNPAGY